MIKVIITPNNAGNVARIAETLTRMGVASNEKKELYQSCHIINSDGEYFIVHFKELYGFEGRPVNLTEEDILRTNSIAKTLETWNLLKLDQDITEVVMNFRILKHSDKKDWKLKPKYNLRNQ